MEKYFVLILIFFIVSCSKDDEQVISKVDEQAIHENGPSFNIRYCEILIGNLDISSGSIEAEVFGTQGCSDCPQELWEELDADQIKNDSNAIFVDLNGPRYSIMDDASGSVFDEDCTENFNNISMRRLASISIDLASANSNSDYIPYPVARSTVFNFYKGSRIYVLENLEGNCYVMQSFSNIVDQDLQLEDLENLGLRLNLPSGWSYKSVVLSEQLDVASIDGSAEIVVDDLRNTYQLIDSGCVE